MHSVKYNKTQFPSTATSYMFRHQAAILREVLSLLMKVLASSA